MQPAPWKTRILAVAEVSRPYSLHPKASVRLPPWKENDFPEWLQFHTRYGDADISNVRINTRIWYGNSAHVVDGYRQQHCVQNCGQIAEGRDMVTFKSL